jgi:hypothetical protein
MRIPVGAHYFCAHSSSSAKSVARVCVCVATVQHLLSLYAKENDRSEDVPVKWAAKMRRERQKKIAVLLNTNWTKLRRVLFLPNLFISNGDHLSYRAFHFAIMNRRHEDNSSRTIPSYLRHSPNFSFTFYIVKSFRSCGEHYSRQPTAILASEIQKIIMCNPLRVKYVCGILFVSLFRFHQAFCTSKSVDADFHPFLGFPICLLPD